MPRYRAVILSPHYDDAVFSCGGMMALEASNGGTVHVLNVFTHFPEVVQSGSIVLNQERQEEEAQAGAILRFSTESMGCTDAFLRRAAYRSPSNLFRRPVREDFEWLPEFSTMLGERLDALEYDALYVPLAIGWHVDHVLCHLVGYSRAATDNVFFYEDAPYCLLPHTASARMHELTGMPEYAPAPHAWVGLARALAQWAPIQDLKPFPVRWIGAAVVGLYLRGLLSLHRPGSAAVSERPCFESVTVDVSAVMEQKLDACRCYRSQVRAFFTDESSCARFHRDYAAAVGRGGLGERYWRRSTRSGSAGTAAATGQAAGALGAGGQQP